MNISHFIERINIGISLATNTMLIFLIIQHSKQIIGSYRYLLLIFALYDIVLAVLHGLIEPKVFNFGTVFTVHSGAFPNHSWIVLFHCACFTVPFALTNINFLHRYWAVKTPEKLALFSNPLFTLILSLYPIGDSMLWFTISLWTDLDESHFVEDYYFDIYRERITGWRLFHHWKNDQLNVHASLILLAAVLIMGFNFSIAMVLASRTLAQIREAKSFSSNYKALQIKLLRALVAQTSVPALFVYIPFGCALFFPFLRISDEFHIANYCMTMTSFFPAWDALVVIILIKDYRDGIISIFCRPKKISSTTTTIWKTQIESLK